MKSRFIISLIIYITAIFSFCKAESTHLLDTIEIRQNNGLKNYYYKDLVLKLDANFYSAFVQSSNPKVMKYFLKYKKLNGSGVLITLGGTLLSTYFIYSLKPGVDKKKLWFLPVGSVCCISVGIPLSIIRSNYLEKTIKEFNIRKQ